MAGKVLATFVTTTSYGTWLPDDITTASQYIAKHPGCRVTLTRGQSTI